MSAKRTRPSKCPNCKVKLVILEPNQYGGVLGCPKCQRTALEILFEEEAGEPIELIENAIKAKDRASRLLSCFGMREMELAAIIIIDKCKRGKSWDTTFRFSEFQTEDNLLNHYSMEQEGFNLLKDTAWIEWAGLGPRDDNGPFKVSKKFIERVAKYGETL